MPTLQPLTQARRLCYALRIPNPAMLGLEEARQQRIGAEQALAGQADVVAVDFGEAFGDEGVEGLGEFLADGDAELLAEVRRVELASLDLEDQLADEPLMIADRQRPVDRQLAAI